MSKKTRKNVSPIPKKQRGAHEHVVTQRRERVATLRNRLLTEREIHEALSNPSMPFFMVNPQTQKPYSAGTIHNDLVYLKQQAIENSQKEFEEYKAMQLAEIREARKVAWSMGFKGLQLVAKFLELEMKLTGTMDASVTYNQFNQQNNLFVGEDGRPLDVTELNDEQLMLVASQGLDVIEGEVVDESDD